MISERNEERAGITSEEVASLIRLPNGNPPNIFLALAPCRAGTTIHLRVFAGAGMQSFYQPLKATLRRLMHKTEEVFRIPSADALFIKETLGPYTDAESSFNPLEVLLKAGYPPERIVLIIVFREPLVTLASWQEQFGSMQSNEMLFINFVTACKTIMEIFRYARSIGISTSAFVYEIQRDYPSGLGVKRLFQRLEIPFSEACISGWQVLPMFGAPGSNIFFASEPQQYIQSSFHASAMSATHLSYYAKEASTLDNLISLAQVHHLIREKVDLMYEGIRVIAASELNLHIHPSQEIIHFLERNE